MNTTQKRTTQSRTNGSQVDRLRLYIMAIPLQLLQEAAVSEQELTVFAQNMMDALCTNSLRDLDDFVLADDHVIVQAELLEAQRLFEKRQSRAEDSGTVVKKTLSK